MDPERMEVNEDARKRRKRKRARRRSNAQAA